ncbi:hypothetical protein B0T19DRAFT_445141 [Cercophora scortea]|uniref:Uncharacterized protein n=1 Tax=Cercophora scortea TaxID=314031 RepID=A0AAE0IAH8_9PEZI|nr:hypothetical protein B0T19DRAFT_445141 [Cercophora scortea]
MTIPDPNSAEPAPLDGRRPSETPELAPVVRTETTSSGTTTTAACHPISNQNRAMSYALSETETLGRAQSEDQLNNHSPMPPPVKELKVLANNVASQATGTGLEIRLLAEPDERQSLLAMKNFRTESRVDVLQILDGKHGYFSCQDDKQVEALVKEVTLSDISSPKLMAICIKLEEFKDATYGYQASISRHTLDFVFQQFGVHAGFLADLLGRPNYWSPVARSKGDAGKLGDVEFFCQHPRWSQYTRYDRGKEAAHMGHVAPCSVYMHHSPLKNVTLYLIVASENGGWFQSLLPRVGVVDGELRAALGPFAVSPFMIHTIMSDIAFEQSKGYVASVKNRLMEQIRQVNDYSEGKAGKNTTPHRRRQGVIRNDKEARLMLEDITKNLHLVSQTADSGIASAHQSIKISDKMVAVHTALMSSLHADPGYHNSARAAVAETHCAMEYIRDSFYSQKDWLGTYKQRKDTAMNFVFNMVTQQDSSTNVDISYKMSKDSSSMNAITILTMIFLPGTFVAVSNPQQGFFSLRVLIMSDVAILTESKDDVLQRRVQGGGFWRRRDDWLFLAVCRGVRVVDNHYELFVVFQESSRALPKDGGAARFEARAAE